MQQWASQMIYQRLLRHRHYDMEASFYNWMYLCFGPQLACLQDGMAFSQTRLYEFLVDMVLLREEKEINQQ
jgi:hypothetical protein